LSDLKLFYLYAELAKASGLATGQFDSNHISYDVTGMCEVGAGQSAG
jgi:hypothetical protein